jgi:CubicO group peptidase (beta-lactamase class C family)
VPRLITTLTVILFICSCSSKATNSNIEQRISRIENGLIEFNLASYSPATLFQPDSAQLANPKTLAERMEYYKVPGVSIAVINNNQMEWTKAYGVMDVNTGMPVKTETIFEAGSTSKLITAVMALHFVEKGLIELDQNVNDYLKSWKVPENEFTSKEKVTLRRLLTHQSGMPESNYDNDDSGKYPTLIDVLNGKPPALNDPAIPEFVPGSRWRYSNVAYNVIQLLLEDVSGKSFQQIAEELVFVPLGMQSSTFIYPLDAEKQKLEAMPHDAEGISRKPLMHLTALAHGGLTTTPADLARFTIEMMLSYQGKSEKIISQKMTKRLFHKECEVDQNQKPLPFSQGLGVFLMGEGRDMLFTHPGSNNPGLQCWLIGWPELGTGTVVMTNGANGMFLEIESINAIIQEYNNNLQ